MAMTGSQEALGGSLGLSIIGNFISLPMQEEQLKAQKAEQDANIASQEAQSAKKLNNIMSHNLVTSSVTGTALGSQSTTASTINQIHSESQDQQAYNTNMKIADYNNQAQQYMMVTNAIGQTVKQASQVAMFAAMA